MLLYYLRHFAKPDIYGPGYKGLLKQGLHEAPYMTYSVVGLPFSLILLPYVIYRYEKLDGDKKRYLYSYTVMRPTDPRLNYFCNHVDRTKSSK